MIGKLNVIKGRLEEATGALTDNSELREKGRADQAIGAGKQAAKQRLDRPKKNAKKRVRKPRKAGARKTGKGRM